MVFLVVFLKEGQKYAPSLTLASTFELCAIFESSFNLSCLWIPLPANLGLQILSGGVEWWCKGRRVRDEKSARNLPGEKLGSSSGILNSPLSANLLIVPEAGHCA